MANLLSEKYKLKTKNRTKTKTEQIVLLTHIPRELRSFTNCFNRDKFAPTERAFWRERDRGREIANDFLRQN